MGHGGEPAPSPRFGLRHCVLLHILQEVSHRAADDLAVNAILRVGRTFEELSSPNDDSLGAKFVSGILSSRRARGDARAGSLGIESTQTAVPT